MRVGREKTRTVPGYPVPSASVALVFLPPSSSQPSSIHDFLVVMSFVFFTVSRYEGRSTAKLAGKKVGRTCLLLGMINLAFFLTRIAQDHHNMLQLWRGS